jgi:hypothetical protein
MPRSVTKHKANGVRTSMEHQKLLIRLRRITARISLALGVMACYVRTMGSGSFVIGVPTDPSAVEVF